MQVANCCQDDQRNNQQTQDLHAENDEIQSESTELEQIQATILKPDEPK